MVVNINEVSDVDRVRKNFRKYKGEDDVKLKLSDKPNKKFMVIKDNKKIHFGSTYPDFTKTRNNNQKKRYIARASNIEGNWADNKYSPNNLSINLLWA